MPIVLSGNAHPVLGAEIARELSIELGHAVIESFADGETRVRVESAVRDQVVVIVQSTCTPVDHLLMVLLLMTDAVRAAGARRIIAVMPYFGYSRQEVRSRDGDPRSAQLVGRMLQVAGVDHVVTLDLHVAAIESILPMPVSSLAPQELFKANLRTWVDDAWSVVSPDAGGMKRAQQCAQLLGCPLAACTKFRAGHDTVFMQHALGDVQGRRCLLVDDMASTGRTLVGAAKALVAAGAIEVAAVFTHAVLAADALDRLVPAPISRLMTSDSIPAPVDDRLQIVPCASYLAQAIRELL